MKYHYRLLGTLVLGLLATGRQASSATFGEEVSFLKQHTDVVVLGDQGKKSRGRRRARLAGTGNDQHGGRR